MDYIIIFLLWYLPGLIAVPYIWCYFQTIDGYSKKSVSINRIKNPTYGGIILTVFWALFGWVPVIIALVMFLFNLITITVSYITDKPFWSKRIK